jgi:hypothetical protein
MSDTNDFTRTADGSLIMRRPQPIESKPGFLAGLLQRFMPQKPVDRYWIPPEAAPAPATNAPVVAPPASVPVALGALPAYNGSQAAQWAEIENEVAKEKAIADQLGGVSKKILASPQLIEGKWINP